MNWRKSSYSNGQGGACVEVALVPWRRSSYSNGAGGNCVEVAGFADEMAVRDSKDRGGPVLAFDRGDWSAFLANLSS